MFAKVLKFLIALALIPFVFAEGWTLYDIFPKQPELWSEIWSESWFLSLCAGAVVWLLIFILLPRAMWLYVLGHEFTHALAVMLAGGKVSAFKVTSTGGHIMTDKVSWWIALSPYFVPIYALIWVAFWITVNCYYPLDAWLPALYFGLGLFWCFHITFTVSMLHPRQTDLTGEGIIFSGVIIAMMNLIIFLILFAILSHDLLGSWRIFMQRIGQCYFFTAREIVHGFRWLWATWQASGKA